MMDMEALLKNSKKIALSFISLTIILLLTFISEYRGYVDYSTLGFFKTLATSVIPFYDGYAEFYGGEKWNFAFQDFYFFLADWFLPYLNLLISVFLYLKYFKMKDDSRVITILLFIKIIGFISFPFYIYRTYQVNYFSLLDAYPFTFVFTCLLFVITIFITIITLNHHKENNITNKSSNSIRRNYFRENIEAKDIGEIKLNENKQELTVGDWFLIKFITYIPLVNLIMYCIWAFSSDNSDQVKSNFAKASLIWMVINTVLYFLFLGSLINFLTSLIGF